MTIIPTGLHSGNIPVHTVHCSYRIHMAIIKHQRHVLLSAIISLLVMCLRQCLSQLLKRKRPQWMCPRATSAVVMCRWRLLWVLHKIIGNKLQYMIAWYGESMPDTDIINVCSLQCLFFSCWETWKSSQHWKVFPLESCSWQVVRGWIHSMKWFANGEEYLGLMK